jgi:hypothetical protein
MTTPPKPLAWSAEHGTSDADWLRAVMAWLDNPEMRPSVIEHIEEAADELDRLTLAPPAQAGGEEDPTLLALIEAEKLIGAYRQATVRWAECHVAADMLRLRHEANEIEHQIVARLASRSPTTPESDQEAWEKFRATATNDDLRTPGYVFLAGRSSVRGER